MAPLEQRIVAFGQVESVWPVPRFGAGPQRHHLCHGRPNSETDGGLAAIAVDAASGKQIWASQIGSEFNRNNDLLQFVDGQLGLRDYRFDLETGTGTLPNGTRKSGAMSVDDVRRRPDGSMKSGPGYPRKVIPAVSPTARTARNSPSPGNARTCDSDTVYGLGFAIKREIADKLTAAPKAGDFLWSKAFPGTEDNALVLTPGALLFGGKSLKDESGGGFVRLFGIPTAPSSR